MFTVGLSAPLKLDAALQITVADPALATVSPQVLTFAAGDISAQTVVVTGSQDNNLADGMTQIALSAAGVSANAIELAIDDDDMQRVVTTTNMVTLTEGGSATVGVHLAFEPSEPTTVSLSSADAARLTASPASVTFNAGDYATDKTITLTAAQDADVAENTVAVSFTATGVPGHTVTATISDNDVQGISTSVASVALTEADTPTPGTFQVTLTQQPSANVTINVASSDTTAATVSPATLTFTPADYANGAAHVVTVTPVSDNNTANETLMLNLTGGALSKVVPVTVTDDDVQAIQPAAASVTVTEGSSTNLGVRLAFDPGSQVSVTVTPSDATAADATPTTLTFNSGNFSQLQQVAISGTQDNDLANENVSVTLSMQGTPSVTVPITVNDNDTQSILLSYAGAPGTLTLPESTQTPSTAVVGVRLAFAPAANVTVTIASNNPNLTVTGGPLTFTPGNFSTVQNVTLTAVDEQNLNPETAIVTFSGGGASATLNVDIPDTDVQGFLVTPGTLPTLAEGGGTSFQVRMNFAPSSAVTASVTSNNPKIRVNGGSSTTITIPANNADQMVTVTVDQDADAADETATITIADAATGSTTPNRQLSVTVDDDDMMAFELDPVTSASSRLDMIEEGAAVTFRVRLTAAPTQNTTVTIVPSTTNEVELSNDGTTFAATTTLAFSPIDFGFKTVTVRGLADPNLVDELFTIAVSGPQSLGAADATVFVRKIENDAQSIVTIPDAPGPILVTESSPASTLRVRLQFQPATSVQVTITPSAQHLLVDGAAQPKTLLFTTQTYNIEQTVFLSTPDDEDQIDRATATVEVSSPALASRFLTVNFDDDDVQSIILSKTSTTIQEPNNTPDNDTFSVRLRYVPQAPTETITVAVPQAQQSKVDVCDSAGATCGASIALAFSDQAGVAGGYDQPQTVMVKAKDDLDVEDENVRLSITSNTPPNATSQFDVTVTDNDELKIVVTPSTATTLDEQPGEGRVTQFTFQAKTNFDPTTPLTITFVSADTGAVAVSPASVTYTSADFAMNATKSFTVTSVADDDVRDELVIVTADSDRTDAVPVTVTVRDHDQQSLNILDSGLQIDEGGQRTIRVQLSREPTNPVTVSVTPTITPVSGLAAQTIEATPSTLTFDANNWDVDHVITVSSPEDVDLDHFEGTVNLAVTSGQTGKEQAAPASSTYGVRDNDVQTVVIVADPTGLTNSAQEGGPTAQFKVRLGARPRLGASDTVQLTAPGNVRFSATDTNAHSVTFTAAEVAANTEKTIVWYVPDGGMNSGFSGNIVLLIDESADQTPPFNAPNANVTTTRAVRAIDDEDTILSSLESSALNGGTEFVRANVAFGFDGTAEGRAAITGRSSVSGGNALLGFSNRATSMLATGPQFATGGLDPTTEVVDFDADDDGTGGDVNAWNVFSSDQNGIVYARYAMDGSVLVAPTVIAPASDSPTDFSVARNTADNVYGVIYRRQTVSRNNLYFRTVNISTGAASSEATVTTATSFVHFHPTLVYVGNGPVTFYDSGSGPTPAPYAALYTENGVQRLLRLSPSGGRLATFSLDGTLFPGDFAHATFARDPIQGDLVIVAAAVHADGQNFGDNRVFLHRIALTVSGLPAQYRVPRIQLTTVPIAPISPPNVSFNGVDYAVTFDSNFGGSNTVGIALYNAQAGARQRQLTNSGDTGQFPSITWALDRWLVRYQAESQGSNGIRVKSGSFDQ